LVTYSARSGDAAFWETDGRGGLSVLRRHESWRPGWTDIVQGNFSDTKYRELCCYDASLGTLHFFVTDGSGSLEPLDEHSDLSTNWTQLASGSFGGSRFADLAAYGVPSRP
jgi:hypothetical protein